MGTMVSQPGWIGQKKEEDYVGGSQGPGSCRCGVGRVLGIALCQGQVYSIQQVVVFMGIVWMVVGYESVIVCLLFCVC